MAALRLGRVGVLDDGGELGAMGHQPPVAGRIGGPEPQHGDAGAVRQRLAQFGQRLRLDQRRVAEDDQHLVGALFQRRPRGQHRMRGAEPFALHENLRARHLRAGFGRHIVAVRPDHHRRGGAAGRLQRRQHVGEKGAPGDRVQHLRARRPHAGALAGRKHDGKAIPRVHRFSLASGPSYPSGAAEKSACNRPTTPGRFLRSESANGFNEVIRTETVPNNAKCGEERG